MFLLRSLFSRRVVVVVFVASIILWATLYLRPKTVLRSVSTTNVKTDVSLPAGRNDVSSASKLDIRRADGDAHTGVRTQTRDVKSGGSDVAQGSNSSALPAKPSVEVKPTEECADKPPIKDTKVPLNTSEITYEQLKREFSHMIQHGGHYAPSTCKARERVALIIPYRDRERNLHILLHNLIPFLIRQQIQFTVFLVEQTKDFLFNRCLMFNVGFVESQKRGDFTCFIIHDTDLIPRDFRNLYRCSSRPRHLVLSRSNEHWMEKLPYHSFIGGALALRKDQMEKSNGCSNSYYGWGLEDDDLEIRLKSHGFPVTRYAMEIGGYYSLGHVKQTDNMARAKLVKTIRSRMNKEGLNTLNYTLVDQQERELYTWLLVKPPPPPTELYASN